MWIVELALRRPLSVAVMALLMLVLGVLSFAMMNVDIFPAINLPVVLVVYNYPGLSAIDMERRIILISERADSTTVNGIDHIESESFEGIGLKRIYFQPGTDMGAAIAQLNATAGTIATILPRGTEPPEIISYVEDRSLRRHSSKGSVGPWSSLATEPIQSSAQDAPCFHHRRDRAMTGEEADGSSTEQNDRMSKSLKNTAQHIPMCLHELTLRQKLDIAVIRARAGLDQYSDLRGTLDRLDHESLPALLRSIPQSAFELAQMIRRSRRFVGVAYIGIDLDHEQVETWVQEHDLGLAFSDQGFLCGSASREVALDHGSSMLLRLLSCSGAPLLLNAPTADGQELVFAPGERFCIVRMERRRLEKHGRRWVVDAEEMYWPMRRLPHWPECDQ